MLRKETTTTTFIKLHPFICHDHSSAVLSCQPESYSIQSGPVCTAMHYCTAHRVYCACRVAFFQHFLRFGLVWVKRRQILILPVESLGRRARQLPAPEACWYPNRNRRNMIRSLRTSAYYSMVVCTFKDGHSQKKTLRRIRKIRKMSYGSVLFLTVSPCVSSSRHRSIRHIMISGSGLYSIYQ